MTSFDSLPELTGATPCRQSPDVDLSDMEYTLPGPFSLPIHAADTKILPAVVLAAENIRLRQVLAPFAAAGNVYRQASVDPNRVALVVEIESASRALKVSDFVAAADALRE